MKALTRSVFSVTVTAVSFLLCILRSQTILTLIKYIQKNANICDVG